MVYFRKTRVSRRSSRKMRKSAMKRRTGLTLTKVNKKLQKLRKAPELKYNQVNDITLSNAFSRQTPVEAPLNALLRGTTHNTRIGDFVTAKYLAINLTWFPFTSTNLATVHQYMRVMVVRIPDFSGVSTNAALSQYFSTASPNVAAMPKNTSVKTDIVVLYDKTFKESNSVANAQEQRIIKIKLNLNNCKISYVLGNAGTFADIEDNAYYLWCFTDTSNAIGSGNLFWSYRFSYTDS